MQPDLRPDIRPGIKFSINPLLYLPKKVIGGKTNFRSFSNFGKMRYVL